MKKKYFRPKKKVEKKKIIIAIIAVIIATLLATLLLCWLIPILWNWFIGIIVIVAVIVSCGLAMEM